MKMFDDIVFLNQVLGDRVLEKEDFVETEQYL